MCIVSDRYIIISFLCICAVSTNVKFKSYLIYVHLTRIILIQIILDQPFSMGVHVLWDSQLEYHMCHNDWEEVARLLDIIPSASLFDRNLQISLDGLEPSVAGYNKQISFLGEYRSSFEELDAIYMDVPDIKIFRPSLSLCSTWLRTLLESELARRFIFLREYWEGTSDIVPILARSGFVTRNFQCAMADGSSSPDIKCSTDTGLCPSNSLDGLHKVLIRHCAQYGLPNLLDIYLDHHKLGLDSDSLYPLVEAVVSFRFAILDLVLTFFFLLFVSWICYHYYLLLTPFYTMDSLVFCWGSTFINSCGSSCKRSIDQA